MGRRVGSQNLQERQIIFMPNEFLVDVIDFFRPNSACLESGYLATSSGFVLVKGSVFLQHI